MTKTGLIELCEIARQHDLSPYQLYEHDYVYEMKYRDRPFYAHYVNGVLYDCIYRNIQFRVITGVGRGFTPMTETYRMYNCHTIVWLIREPAFRYYRDRYGEIRCKLDCISSELCDYADLIPIP